MTMKHTTALASALLLGSGVLLAQTTATGTSSDRDRTKGEHKQKMSAEIVSTDTSAKTITVRNLTMTTSGKERSTAPGTAPGSAGAGEATLRLEGKAADRVGSFKAGDKVTLVCKTNASTTAPGTTSGSATSGTGGTSTTPRPDTPTPQPPAGTSTRTDPTIPADPPRETNDPAAPTAKPPARDARDTAADPMGSLQPCQAVLDISKSGS
jgi:hypothetical protein